MQLSHDVQSISLLANTTYCLPVHKWYTHKKVTNQIKCFFDTTTIWS